MAKHRTRKSVDPTGPGVGKRRKHAAAAGRKGHPRRKAAPSPPLLEPAVAYDAAERRRFWLGLVLTTILIALFYGATVCRWVGLGDTALLIDEASRFNVNSHVNNHRTTMIAGYLFSLLPFGELAFRLNLMSMVAGTVAMALLYVIAYRILRHVTWALLATCAVAVVHSVWWHSTIVENYAFNAIALMVVTLLLLRDEESSHSRHYYAACAVAGFAVFNHVQMGALAPALFVYAVMQRRKQSYGLWSRWLKMALWYALGLLPYALVFARDVLNAANPMQTAYWAIGGDFQSRMFDFNPGLVARGLLLQLVLQFPTPLLALAVFGFDQAMEKKGHLKTHVALLVEFCINTFFFMQFHTWDKFAFLLPSYLVIGYFGIVGIQEMRAHARKLGPWGTRGLLAVVGFCVAFPPYFYRNLPIWGSQDGFWHDDFNNLHTKNTHDCAAYIANPNKRHWDDMARYADSVFERLPEGAIFLDDDGRTFYTLQLYYQKYQHRRPDLRFMLLNSWGFSNWGVTEDDFVRTARRQTPLGMAFMVAAGSPYQSLLDKLAKEGIVPERFELGEGRWIYQLRQVSRAQMTHGERLFVHDTFVGHGFTPGKAPVLKTSFAPDEPIEVKLEFARTPTPVSVRFRWVDPTGATYALSDPFEVPTNEIGVWSRLDRKDGRQPGKWQVSALCGEVEVGSAAFTVR